MAMTDTKSSVEVQTKEVEPRYRLTPHYRAVEKNRTYHIEVEFPGVEKGTIKLKAFKDGFSVTGRRVDIEYHLELSFYNDIVPEKTTSHYQDGLLSADFPIYNPLDYAQEIKLE